MSIFKSGNPTLSQKIFEKSYTQEAEQQGTMSVRGAINKFGFLLLMVIGGAAFTWQQFYSGQPSSAVTFLWIGLIGGLITSIAITFKPNWSPYLAPIYALLEGFLLGAISAIVNKQFETKYPGIILQAVGLTFAVAIAMFLLFNFRIIKATKMFKSIILTASLGIFIFYILWWLLGAFGVEMSFMSWNDTSWLGMGINLFVAGIAALSLILDFDMIEKGAEQGAPKYMEWYGAFGLMVTMVWLYIQILKLLSRLGSRN
jgi:uncharacterized YccA/Bax inhibitor family protein